MDRDRGGLLKLSAQRQAAMQVVAVHFQKWLTFEQRKLQLLRQSKLLPEYKQSSKGWR